MNGWEVREGSEEVEEDGMQSHLQAGGEMRKIKNRKWEDVFEIGQDLEGIMHEIRQCGWNSVTAFGVFFLLLLETATLSGSILNCSIFTAFPVLLTRPVNCYNLNTLTWIPYPPSSCIQYTFTYTVYSSHIHACMYEYNCSMGRNIKLLLLYFKCTLLFVY